MKEMVNPEEGDCPFSFNFDETTFKAGDMISYRVPDSFDDMPFVGRLVEVHDDHVLLVHDDGPSLDLKTANIMRGTLESRPAVSTEDALR